MNAFVNSKWPLIMRSFKGTPLPSSLKGMLPLNIANRTTPPINISIKSLAKCLLFLTYLTIHQRLVYKACVSRFQVRSIAINFIREKHI